MKNKQSKNRFTLGLLATAFVVVGTYNSVVVNSDEFMDHQQVRFVKGLDEMTGVIRPGRVMANYGEWTKLNSQRPVIAESKNKFINAATANPAAPQDTVVEETIASNAAIKEELSLELTEVFNAKKYPQGVKPGDFNGTLSAADGIIDSISVKLPGLDVPFSISSTEMIGNVFEYDGADGKLSGMIYQMDKTSYMVTLTNGPMEGTRLKFSAAKEEEFGNNSAAVAENNYPEENVIAEETPEFAPVVSDDGSNTVVGAFGAEQQAEVAAAPEVEPAAADLQFQNQASAEQMAQGGYNFGSEAPTSL